MTQIHPEYIELAELVAQAQTIVVAVPADPPHRTEPVSILPPGSQFEGKNDPPYAPDAEYDPATPSEGRLDVNYPPYPRFWQAFEVREVLRGDAALAGTRLEARQANDGIHLGGHRSYYIHGIGESPIVETYEPSAQPGATDPRILFLHDLPAGGGFEFVADGAYEVAAKRPEVEALMAGN